MCFSKLTPNLPTTKNEWFLLPYQVLVTAQNSSTLGEFFCIDPWRWRCFFQDCIFCDWERPWPFYRFADDLAWNIFHIRSWSPFQFVIPPLQGILLLIEINTKNIFIMLGDMSVLPSCWWRMINRFGNLIWWMEDNLIGCN